jgi:hypothetical protein
MSKAYHKTSAKRQGGTIVNQSLGRSFILKGDWGDDEAPRHPFSASPLLRVSASRLRLHQLIHYFIGFEDLAQHFPHAPHVN